VVAAMTSKKNKIDMKRVPGGLFLQVFFFAGLSAISRIFCWLWQIGSNEKSSTRYCTDFV
jgi:hypothetical protein